MFDFGHGVTVEPRLSDPIGTETSSDNRNVGYLDRDHKHLFTL